MRDTLNGNRWCQCSTTGLPITTSFGLLSLAGLYLLLSKSKPPLLSLSHSLGFPFLFDFVGLVSVWMLRKVKGKQRKMVKE